MASVRYRPDIDGLRAVAVALVLLFHFDIAPFRGGFVGVDVFFVISGYLITAITLGELEAGRFSRPGLLRAARPAHRAGLARGRCWPARSRACSCSCPTTCGSSAPV